MSVPPQGFGPGYCHLTSRLQPLCGWYACMCYSSSAAYPDCSSPAGLQPIHVLLHYSTSPALASGVCSHPPQASGNGLPCCKWLLPPSCLPPASSLSSIQDMVKSYTPACHHEHHEQPTIDCFLTWLHNGGRICPLTPGQLKPIVLAPQWWKDLSTDTGSAEAYSPGSTMVEGAVH